MDNNHVLNENRYLEITVSNVMIVQKLNCQADFEHYLCSL